MTDPSSIADKSENMPEVSAVKPLHAFSHFRHSFEDKGVWVVKSPDFSPSTCFNVNRDEWKTNINILRGVVIKSFKSRFTVRDDLSYGEGRYEWYFADQVAVNADTYGTATYFPRYVVFPGDWSFEIVKTYVLSLNEFEAKDMLRFSSLRRKSGCPKSTEVILQEYDVGPEDANGIRSPCAGDFIIRLSSEVQQFSFDHDSRVESQTSITWQQLPPGHFYVARADYKFKSHGTDSEGSSKKKRGHESAETVKQKIEEIDTSSFESALAILTEELRMLAEEKLHCMSASTSSVKEEVGVLARQLFDNCMTKVVNNDLYMKRQFSTFGDFRIVNDVNAKLMTLDPDVNEKYTKSSNDYCTMCAITVEVNLESNDDDKDEEGKEKVDEDDSDKDEEIDQEETNKDNTKSQDRDLQHAPETISPKTSKVGLLSVTTGAALNQHFYEKHCIGHNKNQCQYVGCLVDKYNPRDMMNHYKSSVHGGTTFPVHDFPGWNYLLENTRKSVVAGTSYAVPHPKNNHVLMDMAYDERATLIEPIIVDRSYKSKNDTTIQFVHDPVAAATMPTQMFKKSSWSSGHLILEGHETPIVKSYSKKATACKGTEEVLEEIEAGTKAKPRGKPAAQAKKRAREQGEEASQTSTSSQPTGATKRAKGSKGEAKGTKK